MLRDGLMVSSWFVESPIVKTSCKTKFKLHFIFRIKGEWKWVVNRISAIRKLMRPSVRKTTNHHKNGQLNRRGKIHDYAGWASFVCGTIMILSQQLEFLFVPLNASFFLSLCAESILLHECTCTCARSSIECCVNAFVCVIEEFIPRECSNQLWNRNLYLLRSVFFFCLSIKNSNSFVGVTVCGPRRTECSRRRETVQISFRVSHVPLLWSCMCRIKSRAHRTTLVTACICMPITNIYVCS